MGVFEINIVFYILLFVGVILLWFVLAFSFKSIGKFFVGLWDDAKKEMELSKKK